MSLRDGMLSEMQKVAVPVPRWKAERMLDKMLDYLEQHIDDPIAPIPDMPLIWQPRVSEAPLGLLINALRGKSDQ